MSLTVGSTFAGIGGFDLGFERAGMETIWTAETDRNCNTILARHFPEAVRYEDVRHVTRDAVRPDVITGGFPCQDLSVAGRRAGLAGERSGLFHEFHRIVGELAPEWFIIENVPGLLSSQGGEDMQTIIDAMVELGYGLAWRSLDAQFFNLAQRRERVFIVGRAGADVRSAAQVLFEPESVCGNTPPSREAGSGTADGPTHCLRSRGYDAGEDGTGRGTPIVAAHETGQGWWNQDEKAGTLRAEGERPSRPSHVVAALTRNGVGTCGGDDNQAQAGHLLPEVWPDTTPPLMERDYKGPRNYHNGGLQGTVAFQPRIGRNGRGYSEGAVPALGGANAGATSDMRPCVAAPLYYSHDYNQDRVYGTNGPSEACTTARRPNFLTGHAVRRLTPTECCRLQGFPDDWLDGLSDAAKYRALGNAVAVPVAEWIAGRIMALTRTEASRTAVGGHGRPTFTEAPHD